MLEKFLLSIGKVGHGKCLYTYLYNSTYNASLICAFNMITHHVTHLDMGHGGCVGIMLLGCYTEGELWAVVYQVDYNTFPCFP